MATKPNIKFYAGDIRRSQICSSFGPGAIVDFAAPPGGHPISGVVAGLDYWDEVAPGVGGIAHAQVIQEIRLQKKHGVSGFRLPPVKPDKEKGVSDVLLLARFPDWLKCPQCDHLRPSRGWALHPTNNQSAALFCRDCKTPDGAPEAAVPARFVVACESGHLSDFPWQPWIGCTCFDRPNLRLSARTAGLAGLWLSCTNTDCPSTSRSMKDAFSGHAIMEILGKCSGKRPWLGDRESCVEKPRTLQRGGSTTYFSCVDSALSIPPYAGGDRHGVLEGHLKLAQENERSDWNTLIRLNKLEERSGKSKNEIIRYWETCIEAQKASESNSLAGEEYAQLMKSVDAPVSIEDFASAPMKIPMELLSLIHGVAKASRLREVRVNYGFSRIFPSSGAFKGKGKIAHLSLKPKAQIPWLPAVEIRGEGIFISFEQSAIKDWEQRPAVVARFAELEASIREHAEDSMEEFVSPRFVMIHSFAHLLMRQLAFDCGYSSSSLVERVYADSIMCGLLIHTGSPDADGTLGGLARQAHPERLAPTVMAALDSATWCSSDPMCISSANSISTPQNLAACHACLLVAETSCTHFNCYLDRAFLIGTPDDPSIGFFTEILSGKDAGL